MWVGDGDGFAEVDLAARPDRWDSLPTVGDLENWDILPSARILCRTVLYRFTESEGGPVHAEMAGA